MTATMGLFGAKPAATTTATAGRSNVVFFFTHV